MKSNCSEQSSSKNSLHYQTGNITQHRRKTKYKSNLTLSLLPQPSNCAPNSHRTCSAAQNKTKEEHQNLENRISKHKYIIAKQESTVLTSTCRHLRLSPFRSPCNPISQQPSSLRHTVRGFETVIID